MGTGMLSLSLCMLSGCNMSSSGSGDAAVSEEAATAAAAEASATATSMTETEVINSGGVMVARPNATKPNVVTDNCASVDVTASGTDGWTAETLTFTAPPCIFEGARGYTTLDVTGTLALTRSNGDEFNFTSDATNMEWAFTNSSGTYSETRNGTRDITASASGASAASNISVVLAGARHNGTLNHQGSSTFTPAEGTSIVAGQPLPSGSFTHTGTDVWTGADGNVGTFNVTTTTPLAYDSTCKDTMPSVFDSGVLQIQKTTDVKTKVTTITWSNCGVPTIQTDVTVN
jgi:hypothetical protein